MHHRPQIADPQTTGSDVHTNCLVLCPALFLFLDPISNLIRHVSLGDADELEDYPMKTFYLLQNDFRFTLVE